MILTLGCLVGQAPEPLRSYKDTRSSGVTGGSADHQNPRAHRKNGAASAKLTLKALN